MQMSNIYYSPEDFGLEVIGTIEWSEPDYSFDMTVVWRAKRGQYWIGSDSGCSCPSPFEDIRDVNELDGPYLKADAVRRLKYMVNERSDDTWRYGYSKSELLRQVSEIAGR